ncbi:hypothetical protein ACJ5H2_15385 [Nocardioides sp. R1-1]|uniref:hypothetical protein n=1 Tax=Nocardioides sp. R1-1 TaxID=3383502 RepID=UPI0038D11446
MSAALLLAGCSDDGGGDARRAASAGASSPAETPSADAPGAGTPAPSGTRAADVVLGEVADALRSAGSVTVTATFAGVPPRELTIDDTSVIARAVEGLALPEGLVHVGSEQVDGVAAEHYETTLDPAAALAGIALPDGVATLLPDSLDVDVWLDEQDRPVKVRADPGLELRFTAWGAVSAP